jgi:hypothetical protein
MGDKRLRVLHTDTDVLVSNLRGEVGEVVTCWILLRHFMGSAQELQSSDPTADLNNRELRLLWLITDKLRNELIARVSELAEKKIGRTNFHFAVEKLGSCKADAAAFSKFVVSNNLQRKRNREISHREQPEKWFDHRDIRVSYRILVNATALTLRLMKRIDRKYLGPAAPFLWRQARKKRYDLGGPPRALYMLVPHMNLSEEDRIRIAMLEQQEGKAIWNEIETSVNGNPARVLVCKEWGLLLLGGRCVALARYPLQNLSAINFESESEGANP